MAYLNELVNDGVFLLEFEFPVTLLTQYSYSEQSSFGFSSLLCNNRRGSINRFDSLLFGPVVCIREKLSILTITPSMQFDL